jgi:putative ABC transport system permease protein
MHSADATESAEHLIDSGLVLNVVFTGDILQKALDSNKGLNKIIVLVVVVASLLSFLVLYNLTSIYISERTREIATLKVLGFQDGETNSYIYREAFLLTLISIAIGLILGVFLHRFVVHVIEGFATLFFRRIKWLSFLYAASLTVIFSVIMQIVTYFKLRTIDMIEALKSVE